jgi:hypothetical protein
MSKKNRFKTISKTAHKLLSHEEGKLLDFKAAPKGVKEHDFVSFANTDTGGTILVGVKESKGSNGEQIGAVYGCDVSDDMILQITNRALSCIPPVAIDVHIENLSETPFLRIEIPPSQTKPHCTPGGVYCRRDGVRNRALHPSELLKIFLESEARSFSEKFEAAAERVTQDLENLEDSLTTSIRSMGSQLGWTEFKLDDTENTLNSILAYTKVTKFETEDISTRIRSLFRQDERDDPVRNRVRKQLLDNLVEQLSNDHALLKSIVSGASGHVSISGKAAVELDNQEANKVLHEAVNIVQSASVDNETESN